MSVWKSLHIEKPKLLCFGWLVWGFREGFCIGSGWLVGFRNIHILQAGFRAYFVIDKGRVRLFSLHTCTVLEVQKIT